MCARGWSLDAEARVALDILLESGGRGRMEAYNIVAKLHKRLADNDDLLIRDVNVWVRSSVAHAHDKCEPWP